MKDYIKKLLREGLINEEFKDGKLYGYHVTSKDNLESIRRDGLKVGSRKMQGQGLYGFYEYDHAVRYAMKGEVKNPVIVKFYITSPNFLLYLNMDIAKKVIGSDYGLMSQIENYFHGGFDEFYDEVVNANPNMGRDELINKLKFIEENNDEMKQRTFLFSLIPSNLNNKLNIVWDGYYGLEFRINNLNLVKVVGFDEPNFYGKPSSSYEFSLIDDVPNTDEFKDLISFLNDNPILDTYDKVYSIVQNKLDTVRNNREYDYYDNIMKLLKRLK